MCGCNISIYPLYQSGLHQVNIYVNIQQVSYQSDKNLLPHLQIPKNTVILEGGLSPSTINHHLFLPWSKSPNAKTKKVWLHLALFQDRSYPSFPDHTQVVQQQHEVTRAFSLQASRFVNRTQRLTALVLIILEHISVQFETLDFHRLITCVQVKSGNLMVELKYVKMECRLIESV